MWSSEGTKRYRKAISRLYRMLIAYKKNTRTIKQIKMHLISSHPQSSIPRMHKDLSSNDVSIKSLTHPNTRYQDSILITELWRTARVRYLCSLFYIVLKLHSYQVFLHYWRAWPNTRASRSQRVRPTWDIMCDCLLRKTWPSFHLTSWDESEAQMFNRCWPSRACAKL